MCTVRAHTCTHVINMHMCNVCACALYTCAVVCACTHVHAHVYMYLSVHMCGAHAYMCVHVWVCVWYVCACLGMWCVCVCMFEYVCVCVCMWCVIKSSICLFRCLQKPPPTGVISEVWVQDFLLGFGNRVSHSSGWPQAL